MALTKISVTIENNPDKGGIEIKSELTGVTASDIDQVVIKRAEDASTSGVDINYWETIYSFTVEDVDDLEFDLLDILALSTHKYKYSIDLNAENQLMPSGYSVVESETFGDNPDNGDPPFLCEFDGLLIGTFSTQYMSVADWTNEYVRHTSVEYVNTLAGRTPYRVSNSDNNYCTGEVSGLFMKKINNKLVPDYNHMHTERVIDFLTDGTQKLLKTGDGMIWCVSIDSDVNAPFHERFIGKNEIRFNWTETGDVPPFGMVIL